MWQVSHLGRNQEVWTLAVKHPEKNGLGVKLHNDNDKAWLGKEEDNWEIQ